MIRSLLILRPQPGADTTARGARDLGLAVSIHPLFVIVPIPWTAPDSSVFDALLFTSANAPRYGGAALAQYRALPVFAVGDATGQAARDAGFTTVHTGMAAAGALVPVISSAGLGTVLHLGGVVIRPFDPAGLRITHIPVYATRPAGDADALATLATPGTIAMIHSPRAGERLAALLPKARKARVILAAISTAAAAAAGPGWAGIEVADAPNDKALLALCEALCLR